MFRFKAAALAVVFACVLSMQAGASPPPSPFEGSWSGIYLLPGLGGGGTAQFTISSAGVAQGTTVNNDGTAHTIVGRVRDDGWIVGVATFDSRGTAAEFFSGQCHIDGGGNMVCELVGTIQNNSFELIVILAPE